ncbi:MarP family serine protease [Sinomonas sp. ASV486]|uniref:MarP family serine protease n=1 Tax=Sinomonas sp. ASV486 TaxID=3051170 RepID=UPI0027DDDBAE|nr:MarP family serine protease [Sinomonas sp. ASV486]MDQ4488895.1 MarP family serine protease [Sinomonas sp. ASV486]
MNLLDVLLVLVLVGYLANGIRAGFVVSLAGILGFVAGGIAAFFAVPLVSGWLGAGAWRAAGIIIAAVVLMAGGNAVGSALGHRIRRGIRWRGATAIDRGLGGLVSVVVASLVISMTAFTVSTIGVPVLTQQIAGSAVVRALDAATPAPVKEQAAALRAFVIGDGLPKLIESIAPTKPVPVPESVDTNELRAAAPSILRITGTAYQCGQNQTGSGFAVAPDRIITNAHVVAGVSEPVVELPGGGARSGRVVYFDAVRDLAVIAVDGLHVAPLPLTGTSSSGTPAAFGGYPLGGPYQLRPAVIQGTTTVLAPDIYGANEVPKQVYQISGNVQQGNSGGPLLTLDGQVTGVVFAKSDSTADVGYAITMEELTPVAAQASGLTQPVQPGVCTRK